MLSALEEFNIRSHKAHIHCEGCLELGLSVQECCRLFNEILDDDRLMNRLLKERPDVRPFVKELQDARTQFERDTQEIQLEPDGFPQ